MTEIITQPIAKTTAFTNLSNFENSQRMAIALAKSTIVPSHFRGEENLGNVLIALEMSQRIGASPMAVMQNLYILNGRPSWSSSFIIAVINQCGRFEPLRFNMQGDNIESRTCVAWSKDKDGNILESPKVSISMAKKEGWFQKKGSKWQTMPDLMLRYRAAAFFGRLFAPDLLMGMHSEHEQNDIGMKSNPEVNKKTLLDLIDE